jgi:hypothetical protein
LRNLRIFSDFSCFSFSMRGGHICEDMPKTWFSTRQQWFRPKLQTIFGVNCCNFWLRKKNVQSPHIHSFHWTPQDEGVEAVGTAPSVCGPDLFPKSESRMRLWEINKSKGILNFFFAPNLVHCLTLQRVWAVNHSQARMWTTYASGNPFDWEKSRPNLGLGSKWVYDFVGPNSK